jgi:hypothetical protein
VSRQLRRTTAGCLWCLSQYDILQNFLASHNLLLGTQRHRALHLVGKRTSDVLVGDPTAIRWFLALIGAAYGNQGDTQDVVTKSLGSVPSAGMHVTEFQIHVQDLAAAVADRAPASALLKAYIAEAIAALREQLPLVHEVQECQRTLAVQAARK